MNTDFWTEPMVQFGFAGLSAVLLAMFLWLVRRVLDLLEETARVIAGNTAMLQSFGLKQEEGARLYSDLRDRLLSRPCLTLQDD
ncbi:MAG: hypothetical protein V1918_09475 [Planctomycetota bacterium]